jgi:hypothetical protein
MAYADIWTHANDADFQGRCWAALWDIANKVAAGDSGYPAAGQASAQPEDDEYFALKILRDNTRITSRQLAQQILRNATIAASPGTAADNDLAWQINNASWSELRRIG